MKNTKILIAIILLVLIGTLLLALSAKKQEPKQSLPPIQTFSPSPVFTPSTTTGIDATSEKIQQENYAKARQEFFENKPWALKIPLKADNYFISYNPNTDTIVIDLYYSESSSVDKSQQLSQAKQAALNAMKAAGIDTNKQSIEYREWLKKK